MRCAALGMAWWHFHVVELRKKILKNLLLVAIFCQASQHEPALWLGWLNLFIILPLQNGRRKKCGWPQLGQRSNRPWKSCTTSRSKHCLQNTWKHRNSCHEVHNVGIERDTTSELVFQLPESLFSNSGRCGWCDWKEDRKPYKLSFKVRYTRCQQTQNSFMSESNQADSQLPQVLVENPIETSSVSDWCG